MKLRREATCEEEEPIDRMGDQMVLRAVGGDGDEEAFVFTTREKSKHSKEECKEARPSKTQGLMGKLCPGSRYRSCYV